MLFIYYSMFLVCSSVVVFWLVCRVLVLVLCSSWMMVFIVSSGICLCCML